MNTVCVVKVSTTVLEKLPFNNKNSMKMDIVNVLAHPVDGTLTDQTFPRQNYKG